LHELQQAIDRALGKAKPPLRVAILGVGQELKGDDAAGMLLVRGMAKRLPRCENLLFVEAGPTPENFTGLLRKFRPGLVVLADIAWMDEEPGAARWLSPQEATGVSAFTHTLPLSVVADYLTDEIGCEVRILAIQPVQVEFATPITRPVSSAIKKIIHNTDEHRLDGFR
jgi:hydrogenase 3 maturation protease